MTIYVHEHARITGRFRDAAGDLADPTGTITIDVVDPGGELSTYTYPVSVTKSSTGVYYGDHMTDMSGRHKYRIKGTGAVSVIGGGYFDVESAFVKNPELRLHHGDSYKHAHGRRLEWTSDEWPDLSGGSVTLELWKKRDQSRLIDSIAGVLVSSGSEVQTVGVEIDDLDWSQYSDVDVDYQYRLSVALANEPITLAQAPAVISWDGSS